MSWIAFLGLSIVIASILLVPGIVIGRCAQVPWLTTFGAAPAISTGVVSISAILAHWFGFAWNPLAPISLTVLLSIVALFLGRFQKSRMGRYRALPQHTTISPWWMVLGVLIGVCTTAWHLVTVIGSPSNLSQTTDNIFHLSALRWILDNSNGSALANTMGSATNEASFYPLAWHDIATLALQLTHSSDILAAATSMTVVIPSIAWVFGCFYLIRTIGIKSPVALISAGFLVSAFPTFPYIPSFWGVLYPNVLGLSLVPALLALSHELLSIKRHRLPGLTGIPLLGLASAGMVLAHPNSLAIYLALLIPLSIWWMITIFKNSHSARPIYSRVLSATLVTTLLVVVVLVWTFIRPPDSAAIWPPNIHLTGALWQAITLTPTVGHIAVLPVAVLVLVGMISTFIHRHKLWLTAGHLLLVFLWVVVAASPVGQFRTAIVGIWYNDWIRLAAALPITAFPLSVIGTEALVLWISHLIFRQYDASNKITWNILGVISGVWIIMLFLFTQYNPILTNTLVDGSNKYMVNVESNLIDDDELALIKLLPKIVPADERVATLPYNGGSLAYAITGVHTTTTLIFYTPSAEINTINTALNMASSSPEVCEALDELDVTYALDFGPAEVDGTNYGRFSSGFTNLETAPGFTRVSSHGHAALYRIDACG